MLAIVTAARRSIGSAIWVWPVVVVMVVAACGARWGPNGAAGAVILLLTFLAGTIVGVLSASSVDRQLADESVDTSTSASEPDDARPPSAPTQAAPGRLTDLRGACLDGTRLKGADLRGADLRGASLVGCDLSGANLEGANLGRGFGEAEVPVAEDQPLKTPTAEDA